MPDDLRARIAEALASHEPVPGMWDCTCGARTYDFEQHRADAVLTVVQPELDCEAELSQRLFDQRSQMAAERYVWQERGDRYRAAWQSARRRADCRVTAAQLEAERHTTSRVWDKYDLMKARAEKAEAGRDIVRARLESVRALHRPTEGIGYDCDEDDVPGSYGHIAQVCTECGIPGEYGVRWPCPTVQSLDDPPRGVSAPYCGAYMSEWVCTLPSGRHPGWRHVDADGNWWDQTRCPTDCGEPAYRHAANGCPEGPNTAEENLP